jgi:hypothetical protein
MCCFSPIDKQYMPEAQRVTAAQRPSGTAVTQRRATTTRFSLVGKLGADLPSGAPER